jgi:plastocyanin
VRGVQRQPKAILPPKPAKIAAVELDGGIAGHLVLTSKQRAAARSSPLIVYAFEPGREELVTTVKVVTIQRGAGVAATGPTVVARDQVVRFVNQDTIHHRYFSSTDKNQFDLGSLGHGGSGMVRFKRSGEVHFYCSLHSGERGSIHVVPTPFYSLVDEEGRFEIGGLKAGQYELRTYHRSLPARRLGVRVHAGITRTVRLDLSSPPAWPVNR